jgi:bifunctional non-homologous end joining protein LigD
MPGFVAPQLCRLVDTPPVGAIWVHEIKFDGYRMQLRVKDHGSVLRTRKALDWSHRFPEIAAEARVLPDCMIDGEICALDEKGVPNFAELQQALSDERTGDLTFFVFDLLFLQGADLRAAQLSTRKEMLARLIAKTKRAPRLRYAEHFATDGATFLKSACRAHLEGIVSKRLDAPYRSGRSDLWTKEKCRGGQEVVIGGWWGGPSKLRSILIGAYRGKDFVYLGRIGTGFNAENSGPLLRALNKLKRAKSPFTAGLKPPRAKEIIWVEPKLVAEVEYATITRDGLLRQASFKALREDKPARSVVVEQAMPVEKAEELSEGEKKMGASAGKEKPTKIKQAGRENVVAGITISHPEKMLWPATKITAVVTKLDLARYYEKAAPLMLPHITGRPISMVRAPEGITGERFFQRHVLSGAAHATPIKAAGERQPFHSVEDAEGLVSLAQAAVLEIHPWGCKPHDPETPERLIFDLDPAPDVTFDSVIEAAKEIRAVLAGCGFTPFVKTTGGKGIHVVVAIAGDRKHPITWDEAKAFALAVSEKMARARPDRYVTNMSKKQRGGKIFIDYLRNGRMATAVAPWSPRAREGATISVPLAWGQLKKGINPAAFTIASAAPLLKRNREEEIGEALNLSHAFLRRLRADRGIVGRSFGWRAFHTQALLQGRHQIDDVARLGGWGHCCRLFALLLAADEIAQGFLIAIAEFVRIKRPFQLRDDLFRNLHHLPVGFDVRNGFQRICHVHDFVTHPQA